MVLKQGALQPGPAACGVRGPQACLGSWWPWPSFRYLTPPPAFKSPVASPPHGDLLRSPPLSPAPCGEHDFCFRVRGARVPAAHTVAPAGVTGSGGQPPTPGCSRPPQTST